MEGWKDQPKEKMQEQIAMIRSSVMSLFIVMFSTTALQRTQRAWVACCALTLSYDDVTCVVSQEIFTISRQMIAKAKSNASR